MLLVFLGFAPSAAVGPQRWKRLGDVAAERGWRIDVVTIHPDDLGELDLTRLDDLSPGMRLFGFRTGRSALQTLTGLAWSAARPLIKRLRNRELREGHVSGNGATPRVSYSATPGARTASRALRPFRLHATLVEHLDSRRLALIAARLGRALGREHRYDLVLSSGPPHAAHDAARRVAAALDVPLIIDLRDAWVHERLVIPHKLDSSLWMRLQGGVERRCVEEASLVLCTTEPLCQALRQGFPRAAARILTVRNGADTEPLPRAAASRRFVIAYAGNLYAGRDPRLLFRAVARVARQRALTPEELRIEFIGGAGIEGASIDEIALEEGVSEYVVSHGQRTRAEALELLSQATMLVSLPQQDTFAIPAKLYEYMQFNAWLLALAQPGSATASLLADSGADVVQPEDVDAIAATLDRRYEQFRRGTLPLPINHDGRFDRRAQAEIFFQALEPLLRR